MIRHASVEDIPLIVPMVGRLLAAAAIPLAMSGEIAAHTLRGLVLSDLGFLAVVDGGEGPAGFLAGSVATTAVSPALVAVEHGWWAEPGTGGGLTLLSAFEAWAAGKGCRVIRLSTSAAPSRAGRILDRRGYRPAELAWTKDI